MVESWHEAMPQTNHCHLLGIFLTNILFNADNLKTNMCGRIQLLIYIFIFYIYILSDFQRLKYFIFLLSRFEEYKIVTEQIICV